MLRDKNVWSDFDRADCDSYCIGDEYNPRIIYHDPIYHMEQHMTDAANWSFALIMGRLEFRNNPITIEQLKAAIHRPIPEISYYVSKYNWIRDIDML